MMEFEQILEEYEREWSSSCSDSDSSEDSVFSSPPNTSSGYLPTNTTTIIHPPVPHNFVNVQPVSRTPQLKLFVEEKANVGTSAPLTVSIDFGENINTEDIVVADTFVPVAKRTVSPKAKYVLCIKVLGETSQGKEIDLTYLRCDKCKQRMRSKNKEEAESSRFVDILGSKIQQTRKREGSSRDAIQLHFHCTPVKCHKLKSFVTLEISLIDEFGNILTAPHQSAKMYFRTADKRIKEEEIGDKPIKSVNIPNTIPALQRQVDRIFRDLERNHDLEDKTLNKLNQLQQLINYSLQMNQHTEGDHKRGTCAIECDDTEPIVKRTRRSKSQPSY